MSLNKCIEDLRINSNKHQKFGELKKKINDRFELSMVIDIGSIRDLKIGFDNHLNHKRPHIHVTNKKFGRISIAIDNGKVLAPKNTKMNNKYLVEIQEWLLLKKDCLKYIYQNIQNCKRKEDFAPLINAFNKYL